MRALAPLLFAVHLHATGCPELPPCRMVHPNLIVAIADSSESSSEPGQGVAFELKTLIHGRSPGDRFTVQLSNNATAKKGERFYIEAIHEPGQPISLHCLTTSGPYREATHAPRLQYFRRLFTGELRDAALTISTRAPGATVTLTGPAGVRSQSADGRGYAHWKALLPGVYQAHATKANYLVEKAPAPFELLAGACHTENAPLLSPYTVRGTLLTPGGIPVRRTTLSLYAEGTHTYEAETNDKGEFTLPMIHPGTYRVQILYPERRRLSAEVKVPVAPLETEVHLTLQ